MREGLVSETNQRKEIMKCINWCAECQFGIYPDTDKVEFAEKTYHMECLLRIAPKLKIQEELVKMGLDQPTEPEGG